MAKTSSRRVQLIGTAKVVSVESPLWILNASTIPFHLSLKEKDVEIFQTNMAPRSDGYRNGIPLSAIPLPVDFHARRFVCNISITNINSYIQPQEHQETFVELPFGSFSKSSQRRGLIEETQFSLPISMQNASLIASSIKTGSRSERRGTCTMPEQWLLVLRTPTAFR